MKRLSRALSVALVLAAAAPMAYSQEFPSKPIRIVVPFAPATIGDITSRIVAEKFTANTGKQMIVDNQPGANAIIGNEIVSRAAPNGYTLVMASAGSHGLNSSFYTKLPYDPVKDFAPITQLFSSYYFMVVGHHVPANSVKELVAIAKANPGKLTLGYAASMTQLTAELFKLTAGIDMTLVPYKTEPQSLTDLRAGRVDIMFMPTAAALPQIKAKAVKVIAVPSLKRSALLPDVPTVAESGYPGFEAVAWMGYMAPAGTPKEVITKLNTEIVRILRMPDVIEKFERLGLVVVGNTPEGMAEVVKREMAKWAKLFKEVNLPKAN
jgi:tripartite-type tricarboxylate transporter receptor subunit TctC